MALTSTSKKAVAIPVPRSMPAVDFSQRRHFDCVEQALEVVLRRHGFELEDALFQEWGFIFLRGDNGRPFHAIPDFGLDWPTKLREYGIGLVIHRSSTASDTLSNLQVRTARGEAIPVWVDPYYLWYYAATNPRHTRHAVVVESHDSQRDIYSVIDPSPWQRFRGEIPTRELIAAMGSQALSEPERNCCILLGFPRQRPTIASDRVVKAVITNRRAMLDPHTITLDRSVGNPRASQEHPVQGVAGILQLAAAIREWATIPPSDIRACTEQLRGDLTEVGRRRYGHACFLASAWRDTAETACVEASSQLERLAESWRVPGQMLMRDCNPSTAEKAAARIEELAAREKKVLTTLALGLGITEHGTER
jgi:hypothetical protein